MVNTELCDSEYIHKSWETEGPALRLLPIIKLNVIRTGLPQAIKLQTIKK